MVFTPSPSQVPPDFFGVADEDIANANVLDFDDFVTDDSDLNDNLHVAPNTHTYIDAAFRSSQTTQAYLFLNLEFVVLDYEKNEVVSGPHLICDFHQFKSLRRTLFEDSGITGAFPSVIRGEAFIFCLDFCSVINYLDHSKKKGPIHIIEMFPFLKQTEFESGFIDAAFETKKDEPEAYIFLDKWYALINYGPQGKVIKCGLITEAFPCLRDTIFESGIHAAFASHRDNEAYIFKDKFCALIHFSTASTDGTIIGGVKKILDNWPSLRGILPRNNCGPSDHVYEDGPASYSVPDHDSESESESDSDSDSEPVSSEQQDM